MNEIVDKMLKNHQLTILSDVILCQYGVMDCIFLYTFVLYLLIKTPIICQVIIFKMGTL